MGLVFTNIGRIMEVPLGPMSKEPMAVSHHAEDQREDFFTPPLTTEPWVGWKSMIDICKLSALHYRYRSHNNLKTTKDGTYQDGARFPDPPDTIHKYANTNTRGWSHSAHVHRFTARVPGTGGRSAGGYKGSSGTGQPVGPHRGGIQRGPS